MNNFLIALVRIAVPRSVRNALRQPANTFRRCKQKLEFAAGRIKTVEPVPGWSVKCHPICGSAFEIFSSDDEQRAELEEFRSQCFPNMRLLDSGAHWGMFALASSHFSDGTARAVCVEPSPAAVRILRSNIQLNGLAGSIQIVQAAAGKEDSKLEMLTTGAGGADYLVVPHEKRRDTVTVQQVSSTNLCRRLGFWPTHLKLDVEGFEEEAIDGARDILSECRPELFLELHGDLIRKRGRDPKTVLELLRGAGYSKWKLAGQRVAEEDLARRDFNARIFCVPG